MLNGTEMFHEQNVLLMFWQRHKEMQSDEPFQYVTVEVLRG